jgi:ketosteroid isomerase-like protein
MTQESINALRIAYDQFARGDFSAYAGLPDDFELVIAPEMPDAGTFSGEAARRWLASWVDSFERLTVEVIEFIDADDQLAIEFVQGGRPKGSGVAVELRSWAVTTSEMAPSREPSCSSRVRRP